MSELLWPIITGAIPVFITFLAVTSKEGFLKKGAGLIILCGLVALCFIGIYCQVSNTNSKNKDLAKKEKMIEERNAEIKELSEKNLELNKLTEAGVGILKSKSADIKNDVATVGEILNSTIPKLRAIEDFAEQGMKNGAKSLAAQELINENNDESIRVSNERLAIQKRQLEIEERGIVNNKPIINLLKDSIIFDLRNLRIKYKFKNRGNRIAEEFEHSTTYLFVDSLSSSVRYKLIDSDLLNYSKETLIPGSKAIFISSPIPSRYIKDSKILVVLSKVKYYDPMRMPIQSPETLVLIYDDFKNSPEQFKYNLKGNLRAVIKNTIKNDETLKDYYLDLIIK